MLINQGEVRQIGIEVISRVREDFEIETAEYEIKKPDDDTIIQAGVATIEGNKILTLFSASHTGTFYCTLTYRIGPEILKAKLRLEVVK